MNKKFIKKLIILSLIVLIIGVVIVTIDLLTNNYEQESKPIDGSDNSNGNILGEERENIEKTSVNLIEEYINKIPNLKEYAKKNSITSFSISDLKNIFDLDISEFEKLEYSCKPDSTIIEFTSDYNDYNITLACEALFLK